MTSSACLLLFAWLGHVGFAPPAASQAAQPQPVQDSSDYVGEYTRADGVPIYVADVDHGLFVVVTGSVFALEPAGPDRFDLVGVPETVSFERDADGRVVAVTRGRYPRRTEAVPPEITALLGVGGAATYSYAPPTAS